MKKILSLVLVAAMMLSLVVFAPAASAADSYTVEVTDATAPAGGQVTLDVLVSGVSMYAYAFGFQYDATRLENPVITPNDEYFVDGGSIAGNDWMASYTTNVKGAVGAFAIDEPTVVATITFDVKADAPAGDAFVKCVPFSNTSDIFIAPTNVFADAIFTWDAVAGNVTVVADGSFYTPADNMWDFDAEYGSIMGYWGDDLVGDVVIPTQIGGVDVVDIYGSSTAAVLDGFSVSSIVIPENITYISAYALLNLADCTDIYILNADCELDNYSVGFNGSWDRRGNFKAAGTVAGLTIHAPSGSLAEEYATACGIAFEAVDSIPTYTVVANGNESVNYAVTGSVTLPESYATAGKTIVGWNVNGSVVAPGATVAIEGNTVIEAVTVGFATQNGASIKVVDTAADTALRFTVALNKADYAALEEIYGAANVSHGMLIAPQQYIKRAGAITHAALDAAGLPMLDYAMTGCYVETADEYILAASVKGFSANTLAKNPRFAAVGYIAINIGGETTYVYGDFDASAARDAKFVLTEALATATGDAKTWLTTLLGTFGN